ncbi:YbaB/EbfC DNA-binding family protein [Sanguibacter gelidistatuariae]|uniref:YbaB/EbfC DNA-binding family protein n=1 Tax=Sanguibacter gelidistatuariae TaxID=1814289 RepID=A0A1G6GSQ3_9MICO|nr:YbaB/EbfC family nucleoid-associated protein [Sanguibacter gelidistatuariae]SDB84974.1 YbaB/EbfC DNA-binding family protein [Sanguibacter gelidistatuariae]
MTDTYGIGILCSPLLGIPPSRVQADASAGTTRMRDLVDATADNLETATVTQAVVDAARNGDWIGVSLAGAGIGVREEPTAFITDPIGELLASGAAFLMEYLDPLPAMLDSIAGHPGEIDAFADALRGTSASASCKGTAGALTVASQIVATVRSVAGDLIADLVAKVIKWVAQTPCTAGLGATWAIPDACAAVAEWVLHFSGWLKDLVASIGRLGELVTEASGGPKGISEKAQEVATAQIDAWVAQAQRQAGAAQALRASIEALEVSHWSPGREVHVVVDHAGLLRDIEFSDGALDLPHTDLSGLIMTTVREARALLRTAAAQVAGEHVRSSDSLARSLTKEYRTIFADDGVVPDDGPGGKA